MSYASSDDVLARAGRFAGLFSVSGKRPDTSDLDAFLDTTAASIDAEIRRRGYDPASLSAELEEALLDVNAWAALIRALPAASPGDDAIQPTIDRGVAILKASGFEDLASGGSDVFGILGALEAGQGGGGSGTSAGSTWDLFGDSAELSSEDADVLEPVWRRGQSL